jgi:hypothetical protein
MMRCSPPAPSFSRFFSSAALVLAGLLLSPHSLVADEPLTREQLSKLVEQKVETPLIVSLVKRNCVSFSINGDNLASLAASLPKPVLEAAIECRGQAAPQNAPTVSKPATAAPLVPVVAPAPVAPPVPATPLAPPSAAGPAIAPSVGPATLALQVEDSHGEAIDVSDLPSNECHLFVDSPANLKVFATSGNSSGKKPAILLNYVYKNSARGLYDSPRISLTPGIHDIAVYCGPILRRNTVGLTAESGKKYTVVIKLNNLLGSSAKVIDVRTD